MATLRGDRPENAVPIAIVRPADLDNGPAFLSDAQKAWISATSFTAKSGTKILLPGPDGALQMVLFGIGSEPDISPLSFGTLSKELPEGDYCIHEASPAESAEADIALGWMLGDYSFDRYRKSTEKKKTLFVSSDDVRAEVTAIADGVTLARDLINTPANDLGPEELAEAVRDLSVRFGAVFSEISGEALLAENFPLIHAVGHGSDREPRLVDLTWGDETNPKVTLVGKGVIFDTGGLDIKPASAMLLMKKDMGGAANVLGLASVIMAQELPVRLRVLIPAVENAVSGRAFRPGDVFRSRKGLTVEIGNTDAEGRLVLADALTLACEEKPDLLIDMATLTGAARVALGPEVPPFFTDDCNLAAEILTACSEVYDPLWQLPLWSPYDSLLDSKVADLNNVSSGGFAGAITAALFLRRFADAAPAWAHFDIYGWAPSARPGIPEGGAAQGIRALYEVLKKRYPKAAD